MKYNPTISYQLLIFPSSYILIFSQFFPFARGNMCSVLFQHSKWKNLPTIHKKSRCHHQHIWNSTPDVSTFFQKSNAFYFQGEGGGRGSGLQLFSRMPNLKSKIFSQGGGGVRTPTFSKVGKSEVQNFFSGWGGVQTPTFSKDAKSEVQNFFSGWGGGGGQSLTNFWWWVQIC